VARTRPGPGQKNLDRALADLNEAVALVPQADVYVSRAYVLAKKGDYRGAAADFQEAVRLDGKNAVAHNNLAWLLATCPQDDLRDGPRALEEAQLACELSDWKESYCLGTLAAAYAEVGRFDEAIMWHKKALEMPGYVRQYGQKVVERTNLYEQGKPCRDDWETA
jgi:tetratricopeptide (TPR) repeat protein